MTPFGPGCSRASSKSSGVWNPKKSLPWKRLITRCQKLWEAYDEKPLKKNLVAFGAHIEKMKASKSVRVKTEARRAARAFNAEFRARGWKKPLANPKRKVTRRSNPPAGSPLRREWDRDRKAGAPLATESQWPDSRTVYFMLGAREQRKAFTKVAKEMLRLGFAIDYTYTRYGEYDDDSAARGELEVQSRSMPLPWKRMNEIWNSAFVDGGDSWWMDAYDDEYRGPEDQSAAAETLLEKHGGKIPLTYGRVEITNPKGTKRKPAKKKATKRKASKRRANPDESSLFHVTYAGRLFEIAEEGLASDRRSSIGGESYDWHRRGSIFLSESGGVSYWYHWAAQWAFDRSDEPADDGLVPVVLRIVGGPLTDDLEFIKVCEDDDLGWADSTQPAYRCKTTIGPKYLQVWTGSSWVPVRDYGEVDLSTSFDIHTWENVLLPNDKEMEAGKKAKRNPIHHSPRHKEEIHVLDSAGWHVILEPSSIEGPDESTINAVKLVDPDNESYYALITRSARDPGQWQATRFDERGPVGHSTKDTLIEAVNDTRKWYGLTVAEVVEKNPRKKKVRRKKKR